MTLRNLHTVIIIYFSYLEIFLLLVSYYYITYYLVMYIVGKLFIRKMIQLCINYYYFHITYYDSAGYY